MNGKIYLAKNKANGKGYVGQTIQRFSVRKSTHLNSALKGCDCIVVFYRSIRKYGKDGFEWSVLEDKIETHKQLNERERYWIKRLHTFGRNGYNRTEGGCGSSGACVSLRERKRRSDYKRKWWSDPKNVETMRLHAKKRWSNKNFKDSLSGKNHHQYGKRPKEHVIEALRKSNKERKLTERQLKSLEFGRSRLLTMTEKEKKIWRDKISRTKQKNPWRPNKEQRDKISRKLKGRYGGSKNPAARAVEISTDGIHWTSFSTVKEASEKIGVTRGAISMACSGKSKKSAGYYCRYK